MTGLDSVSTMQRPVERREPGGVLRARVLTYATVALLLVVAVGNVERWPLTSYRLFSKVRTGVEVSYVLAAEEADGDRHPIRLRPAARSVPHQLPSLARLDPAQQRAKVAALLELAEPDPTGFDPRQAAYIVVQRITRQLDIRGGPSSELTRRDLVKVPLR